MQRMILFLVLASFGVLDPGPGVAAPAPRVARAQATDTPTVLAQNRPRRARPHIRVRPRYPYRRYHSPYPLPYATEYPGPNAVRQCTDWYATEYRPSGPVIVPKMRCWWVPG